MIYAIRLLKTFHVTLFQKCFLTLTLKVDRFPLEIWASHICHPKNLVDRTFNENLRSTVRGCNAKRPKTATPNRVVCWSLLSHESESWTEARCMYVFFLFFSSQVFVNFWAVLQVIVRVPVRRFFNHTSEVGWVASAAKSLTWWVSCQGKKTVQVQTVSWILLDLLLKSDKISLTWL